MLAHINGHNPPTHTHQQGKIKTPLPREEVELGLASDAGDAMTSPTTGGPSQQGNVQTGTRTNPGNPSNPDPKPETKDVQDPMGETESHENDIQKRNLEHGGTFTTRK